LEYGAKRVYRLKSDGKSYLKNHVHKIAYDVNGNFIGRAIVGRDLTENINECLVTTHSMIDEFVNMDDFEEIEVQISEK
jgi:hypothetical protein